MDKLEVLSQCTVEENVVKLPDVNLDRKQYLDVKKALEQIGGKWKGGKVFGFVFKSDPTELLADIAGGAKRNLKKEFQFFATPEGLAKELVQYACIEDMNTVLEPSAGQGAIIKAINERHPNKSVQCYEMMPDNKLELSQLDSVDFLGDDFLSDEEYSEICFDRIVANPPFTKNQDIDHVKAMYSRLNTSGRLVSIMSTHWQLSNNKKESEFRDWLDSVGAEVIEVEEGAFKESGTKIPTVIVIINK